MYDGLLYIVYSGNKRYYTKLYGSSRFRDPPNRSTCKIDKTRTDPSGSNLTEPNCGFFFFSCLVCLNGSYVYIYMSTSTFYDNPSMLMITCRAQRSANRQKNYKKSADHINSDKIKLYTKFIYRLKFVV